MRMEASYPLDHAGAFELQLQHPRQGSNPHFPLAFLLKCSPEYKDGGVLSIRPRRHRSGDATKRHRGDSNPCGQSPMDFESISLTARTQCHANAAQATLLYSRARGECGAAAAPPQTMPGRAWPGRRTPETVR